MGLLQGSSRSDIRSGIALFPYSLRSPESVMVLIVYASAVTFKGCNNRFVLVQYLKLQGVLILFFIARRVGPLYQSGSEGKGYPSKLGEGLTGGSKIKCIGMVPNTICSVGKIYLINYSSQTFELLQRGVLRFTVELSVLGVQTVFGTFRAVSDQHSISI